MESTQSTMARTGLIDAIERAEAEALAQHQAGTCHLSEWSCSHCETARAATTEVGWVAREACALIAEGVRPGSERWEAYMVRKRALLSYIEEQRA